MTAEHSRVDRQTDRIIQLLRQGAKYNTELAGVALKYTSRISDARKRGHTIVCTRIKGSPGLTLYRLAA